MNEAVLEIKDAVIGIRVAVERMGVIEERQTVLQEQSRRLDRAIEQERANRVAADQAEAAERRQTFEKIGVRLDNMGLSVRTNTAARGWFERIITPLVASALGALSVWILAL